MLPKATNFPARIRVHQDPVAATRRAPPYGRGALVFDHDFQLLVLECLETFFASAVMDSIVAIPFWLLPIAIIGAIPIGRNSKH